MAKKRILNRFDPVSSIPILNKMIQELETKVDNLKISGGSTITKISQLINDSNYIIDSNYVHTDNNYTTADKNKVASAVDESELSAVALSGDYTNLSNRPTIPTKTSDLTNDSGYLTQPELTAHNASSVAHQDIRASIPEPYNLPQASADTLGGIKVGNGLYIGSDGTLNASGGGAADYIAEYGENDDWYWEKWNSGKARLITRTLISTGTLTMTANTGQYYSNALSITLPFALTELMTFSAMSSSYPISNVMRTTSTGSNKLDYRVIKAGNYTGSVQLKFDIIGKWK